MGYPVAYIQESGIPIEIRNDLGYTLSGQRVTEAYPGIQWHGTPDKQQAGGAWGYYTLPQQQPKLQQPQQQAPQQAPVNIQSSISPQIQSILSQIESYTNRPPQTPEEIMQGETYKGMKGAIDTQTADAMRSVKAQLAAAGVLGEGSTPAVERMGHVEQQASQALGALIPQLVQASQAQRSAGLQELLSMLSAQSGAEGQAYQQGLGMFSALAPYQYLTEHQRQTLPIDWANVIGEVPGTVPGQSLPSGYNPPSGYDATDVQEIIRAMQANSQRWAGASDTEKSALAAQNQQLGRVLGLVYKPETGTWHWPNGSRVY